MTEKPKPPWDVGNDGKDYDALVAWTNKQLEPAELRELSNEDYYELRDLLDANYNASMEEYYTRRIKRGRIVIAIDDLIALIGDDREMQRLTRHKLAKILKQPRGRQKGERQHKGELSVDERRRCEEALNDAARILELWDLTWPKKDGRRRREHQALKIAVARRGLDLDALDVYRDNK